MVKESTTLPRLGITFVVTERVDEMWRFYEDVVGLRDGRHDPGHHVWYTLGDRDFVLHATRSEPGPEFTPKTGVQLTFVIQGDLEAIAERLRTRGRPAWGPYDGGKRLLLYTLDPDGNVVLLSVEK